MGRSGSFLRSKKVIVVSDYTEKCELEPARHLTGANLILTLQSTASVAAFCTNNSSVDPST
jgi:hypothetical protein